jgi:chemotaxis protein MotB
MAFWRAKQRRCAMKWTWTLLVMAAVGTAAAPSRVPSEAASCTTQAIDARAAERTAARTAAIEKIASLVRETERDSVTLATTLSKEIAAGVIEIETNGRTIALRVKDRGSFESGSASLTRDFKPVLKIIRGALKNTSGTIRVEGHTDDMPVTGSQFGSNLALSSARAVAVAQALFQDSTIDESRFTVIGYAATRPLVTNDSPEARARNRRVEIVIQQGLNDDVKHDLDAIRRNDSEGFQRVRIELMRRFGVSLDDA